MTAMTVRADDRRWLRIATDTVADKAVCYPTSRDLPRLIAWRSNYGFLGAYFDFLFGG
jgi:hypothetical protein